ncbi:MAG TPA: response regulator [Planctomycetota bacterium]|nr:response regulator [Planctomycetota bacterium]
MRVLIIDDDRPHGESLSDLLNARGHEAYFAPSLPEADWLLELFRFHLALLDWDMPERSGPQVARALVERDPALRPVLMSAREPRPGDLLAEKAPPMPFLPKPIRVDTLLALIASLSSDSLSLTLRLEFPLDRYRRPRRRP